MTDRGDVLWRPRGWLLSMVFGVLAVGLALVRFYKFRPFLDEPHAFRQAWTSTYTLEFFRSGMNIFLPSINSIGNYRHILVEFPLPEWITALVYHATGPSLLVDRAISIAFFLGSAYFLFQAVSIVRDRVLAWMVVLIYMAVPLGIYFSRAIHIDNAAMCFGHALVYYYLRYGETGRGRDLAFAIVASALGLLVKAPYVFYLILPALYFQLARRQWRRAAISAVAFGGALVLSLGWFAYSQSVNRRAPDLSFIRGYEATADRLDFYVGAAGRRMSGQDWSTIRGRLRHEVAVNVWWIFVPLAVLWRRTFPLAWNFAAVWLLGACLFLIVFFPANVLHNYYQLTFIAPFALSMAIPLYRCVVDEGRFARLLHWVGVGLLAAYVAMGVRFAVRNYYWVDGDGIRVGEFVQANTTERDLVIMAYNDAYYLDPRYLYYADRRGWSIRAAWLEPQAIEGLKVYGATAVVTSDIWPAPEATTRYLRGLRLVNTLELGSQHVFVHRID